MNHKPSADTAPEFLVKFDAVTLRVAGDDRFRNIRWLIRPHEQWAVIGPNGSGKSILLKAILGRIPISRGELLYGLNGRIEWDSDDGAIGYVSIE